jgi:hypothetical protein
VTDRRVDKRLNAEDLRQANWYMEISEGSDIPEKHLVLAGWRFGKTVAGMYCMLPPQLKVGDILCVPAGGQVPLLLRLRSGDDELYELIGEAYVHGVMGGMAMIRSYANVHKMMQADPNLDFEHMHRKLQVESRGMHHNTSSSLSLPYGFSPHSADDLVGLTRRRPGASISFLY